MLSSVCIGSNNITRAGEFYDAVLSILDMQRSIDTEVEIGYATAGGNTCLWVLTPYDGKAATHGNGTQLIFQARSASEVDDFHAEAVRQGGTDEGAPGPRDYRRGYYGAYCRDLDGNKLHIFHLASDL